ncbi:MAG: hypothetical protein PHI23_02450 [Candidatus Peribacteraceae bacterium]|nr:hypothetical protein [Candidatus Peribacteraceae bacterium]
MQHTCKNPWCKQPFEVTSDDLTMLQELAPVIGGVAFDIPPPTLCWQCRSQRRYAHRNERNLHWRKDDLMGEQILSIYAQDKPFPVYASENWNSDRWDSATYGRPFDFSRPFFEQYVSLRDRVPRMALAAVLNENCPYVNQVWHSRNCYLCIDAGYCEDVLYAYATYHCRDTADCAHTRDSELSYELVDCVKCYGCAVLQDCADCRDSLFSVDCKQCSHVVFCWNLRGKEYCFHNEQMTKEQWEAAVQPLRSGSSQAWTKAREDFHVLLPRVIRRANHNLQCEDCVADYFLHSQRCFHCFDGDTSQDLRYCCRMDERVKTAMDIDQASDVELAYNGLSISGNGIWWCSASWSETNSNLLYCDLARSASHCFGCVGIKNKKYCILNQQYSREEYETLVPRIIEHMRKMGEWGQFFPAETSAFGYNESMASAYFPLSRAEVLRRGWHWRDVPEEQPQAERIIEAKDLPDRIDDVSDDILRSAIRCPATGRLFKVIKQELSYYRAHKIPLPRLHPDERHRRRIALRNPRKLWERSCACCAKPIFTSYAPERPERVYCEECYLREVY